MIEKQEYIYSALYNMGCSIAESDLLHIYTYCFGSIQRRNKVKCKAKPIVGMSGQRSSYSTCQSMKPERDRAMPSVTAGQCANVGCLPDQKCVELIDGTTECIQIGFPRDCKDIYQYFGQRNGMYITYPYLPNTTRMIIVCDMDHAEGGYMMIQRRLDGSVDFTKNWNEYENGFGDLESEFWLGNSALHTLTSIGNTLLHIKLESHSGVWKYAEYTSYSVGDSQDNYRNSYNVYSGTAGNSLDNCNEAQFTTYDADHDTHSSNCADIRGKGGWWFKSCCRSNLNGVYCASGESDATRCNRWYHFERDKGLKTSIMLLRRNN